MELCVQKINNTLIPVREQDAEWIKKASKDTNYFIGKVKRLRNGVYFRKWWAMVNFAYEHWDPAPLETEYGQVEKNFDRFRKDLIVLAGYYEVVYKINGEIVLTPKSIAWDKMEEDEFQRLYGATFNAISKHIFNGVDVQELEKIEAKLWSFL